MSQGLVTDAGQARERAFRVAVALVGVSLVGFLLALAFTWPSTFVIDEEGADAEVGAADLVNGTVASIPLPPLLVLVVAAALVRRSDRWGTVGAVLLTLLGVVFTIGGIGEIVSDNDAVDRAVVVAAGAVYVAGGLTLAVTALGVLAGRRSAVSAD